MSFKAESMMLEELDKLEMSDDSTLQVLEYNQYEKTTKFVELHCSAFIVSPILLKNSPGGS